jgi:hypothetical protein
LEDASEYGQSRLVNWNGSFDSWGYGVIQGIPESFTINISHQNNL